MNVSSSAAVLFDNKGRTTRCDAWLWWRVATFPDPVAILDMRGFVVQNNWVQGPPIVIQLQLDMIPQDRTPDLDRALALRLRTARSRCVRGRHPARLRHLPCACLHCLWHTCSVFVSCVCTVFGHRQTFSSRSCEACSFVEEEELVAGFVAAVQSLHLLGWNRWICDWLLTLSRGHSFDMASSRDAAALREETQRLRQRLEEERKKLNDASC